LAGAKTYRAAEVTLAQNCEGGARGPLQPAAPYIAEREPDEHRVLDPATNPA